MNVNFLIALLTAMFSFACILSSNAESATEKRGEWQTHAYPKIGLKSEPYTPTIAPMVPTNLLTLGQLLGYERPSSGAKLAYVRLNSQTPCPPRGAVPVNQGCSRRLFHSRHPVRFR